MKSLKLKDRDTISCTDLQIRIHRLGIKALYNLALKTPSQDSTVFAGYNKERKKCDGDVWEKHSNLAEI